VSIGPGGVQGDRVSRHAAISADGRYVAFESLATTLIDGDTNFASDVFVHDRVAHVTARVSVKTGGAQARGDSYRPAISADGQVIAFAYGDSDLSDADTNIELDIYVHYRATGTTELVSIGADGFGANGSSSFPQISATGQVVVFDSNASNLVAGDNNRLPDVFVRDLGLDQTERVITTIDFSPEICAGDITCESIIIGMYHEAYGQRFRPAISADGRYVAFGFVVRNDAGQAVLQLSRHDRQTGEGFRWLTVAATPPSAMMERSWRFIQTPAL
jgi:Tol biopolymer transport system component